MVRFNTFAANREKAASLQSVETPLGVSIKILTAELYEFRHFFGTQREGRLLILHRGFVRDQNAPEKGPPGYRKHQNLRGEHVR
jgi:hypothetical protein